MSAQDLKYNMFIIFMFVARYQEKCIRANCGYRQDGALWDGAPCRFWCVVTNFLQEMLQDRTLCRFIHRPPSRQHTPAVEQGVMDWTRPWMWILMALLGYYYSSGIICSLVCVILTARIIMAVTSAKEPVVPSQPRMYCACLPCIFS